SGWSSWCSWSGTTDTATRSPATAARLAAGRITAQEEELELPRAGVPWLLVVVFARHLLTHYFRVPRGVVRATLAARAFRRRRAADDYFGARPASARQRPASARQRPASARQCLAEVLEQVVNCLNADRQADQIAGHLQRRSGHRRMGHPGGMLDQGFHPAERLPQREETGPPADRDRGLLA